MSRGQTHGARGLGAIFLIPTLLAALGLIGLVGALLEDGLWDAIGCALVATAIIAVIWARVRARRR